MAGYYEWEWAGFFRSWASNTSSLTCFAPHEHAPRTGTLHTHIPVHVKTERADTGTSAQEEKKILKVPFTGCERGSGCDHMMMDGEIRGKKRAVLSY